MLGKGLGQEPGWARRLEMLKSILGQAPRKAGEGKGLRGEVGMEDS